MVQHKLCWDANNAARRSKQRKVGLDWYEFLCFESPTALFASQHNLFRIMWSDRAKVIVASWLVRSSPDWAAWVRALARDIVLCCWAKHFTLTVPLSSQAYKWALMNLMLWGNPATLWGNPWTSIPSRKGGGGGVEILLVTSCYRNRAYPQAWWATCLVYRIHLLQFGSE